MSSFMPNPARNNDPNGLMNIELNPNFYTQFAIGFQFLPDAVKGIVVFCKLSFEYFVAMYALPLEMYLRWRLGVRTISAYQLCFLCGCAFLAMFSGGFLLPLFLVGAAGLAIWHCYEARRWERLHPRVSWRMSYSFGEPVVWLAIARKLARRGHSPRWITESRVFRFFEPASGLVPGIALMLLPFTRLPGFVLLISGFALLLKRHFLHLRIVNATRDRLDAVAVGKLLSKQADEETEITTPVKIFEVRLLPIGRPPISRTPSAMPSPPAGSIPSWGEGRLIDGPDDVGKVIVECPHCSRTIRCLAKRAEDGVKCPNCAEWFMFAVPAPAIT